MTRPSAAPLSTAAPVVPPACLYRLFTRYRLKFAPAHRHAYGGEFRRPERALAAGTPYEWPATRPWPESRA